MSGEKGFRMSDVGFRVCLLLLMGLIAFAGGGIDGGCGFVVAYLFRGLLGAWPRGSGSGSGWLRLGGFGRLRLSGLLHPDCLQLAEDFVRAEVHTVEAGFVARGESHRTGLVGLRGVGFRELDTAIALREFLSDCRLLANHLAIEEGAFDGPESTHTPAGGDHLVDQIFFGCRRGIVNCTRQWGKSTVAAAKAVHRACSEPGSLTLALAPGGRQSGELIRKAKAFVGELGMRVRGDGDNDLSIAFPNGSRIVGLPGNEAMVRGFTASLILIDEAARVTDGLRSEERRVGKEG